MNQIIQMKHKKVSKPVNLTGGKPVGYLQAWLRTRTRDLKEFNNFKNESPCGNVKLLTEILIVNMHLTGTPANSKQSFN